MPIIVAWPRAATERLDDRLAVIRGRGSEKFLTVAENILYRGNAEDRLRGVDRYGRPLASLKSIRKGKYKGKTGPPLAPSGAYSRVVTHFVTRRGTAGGSRYIDAGWQDVLSTQGKPFLQYHIAGAFPQPKRDIAGISPRTWARIRQSFRDWAIGVFRKRS